MKKIFRPLIFWSSVKLLKTVPPDGADLSLTKRNTNNAIKSEDKPIHKNIGLSAPREIRLKMILIEMKK